MRTSAMGDVALLAPVVRAFRGQYPDVELIILTRPAFASFFEGDSGIRLVLPDFKGRHKGIPGILRLFRDINETGGIDKVIDLHDVMRTFLLRLLFKLKNIPVLVIDKGRKEKYDIIKGNNRKTLPHTVERYLEVFIQAGFNLKLTPGPYIMIDPEARQKASDIIGNSTVLNIGVAPYAKHPLKMWPGDNMINLLRLIENKYKVRFWLLGGNDEKEKIEDLAKKVPSAVNLCSKLTLKEELALIKMLDFMITMDSSNMHMASMVGTPVISIWCGTDPVTGFGAWMQPDNFSIRIPADELPCRPCTVYGKGKCKRGDLACMNWLTSGKVLEMMEQTGVLNLKM